MAKSKRAFDYSLDYSALNLRRRKALYRVGKGEQGVLLVEPYKSEILPYWKFRTPVDAKKSARKISQIFKDYLANDDFIGMDMARKFMQMGYTRSRRYANHKSGKKYDGPVPMSKRGQSGAHGRRTLKNDEDPVKAESARIFYSHWQKLEKNRIYQEKKSEWKAKLG